MPFDSIFTDHQLFSDLAIAQTIGDQFKYLQLAPSKVSEHLGGFAVLTPQVLQNARCHVRMQSHLSLDGAVQGIHDFFIDGVFIAELIPTLRPDLAILLQKNLFNTDIELLLEHVTGRIDDGWRVEVTQLLQLPNQIRDWRAMIWEVMGESIHQRVQSFSELATALYAFSAIGSFGVASTATRGAKLPPALSGFFRGARTDDEMRNFLIDAVEYLSTFAEGNIEVPVRIIRAINDVERIAQIEESALPPEKQDVIRTCILQIARLAGENG